MSVSVLILLLLIFFPHSLYAVSLEVVPEAVAVGVGQEIRFDIVADTEGVVVNALQGSFELPKILEPSRIEDGKSIVGLWIRRPQLDEPGKLISFAGIVPGGFRGTGVIFSLFARTRSEGETELIVSKSAVSLHDGRGTAAAVTLPVRRLSIVRNIYVSLPDRSRDKTTPLPFQPIVGQSRDLFAGKYFLMFNTLDAEAGVERYEILESDRLLRETELESRSRAGWRSVQNPSELRDQSLRSFIYIRAFDRAGNSRSSLISPSQAALVRDSNFNNSALFGILFVIIAAIVGSKFFRRRVK